jgi:SAM-dependent methyltransferase
MNLNAMLPTDVTTDIRKRNEKFFQNLDPENMFKKSPNKVVKQYVEYHREKQLRLMIKYLKPTKNDKVLVVGVGNGREIKILLNFVNEVYGVDISRNNLSYCKKRFENRFIGSECNLEKDKILFDTGFFDKIVCFNVLPYFSLEGINNYFNETSRIIKSHGKMLIKIRNKRFPLAMIVERQLVLNRMNDHRPIYYSRNLSDYKKILNKCDIKIELSEGGDFFTDLNQMNGNNLLSDIVIRIIRKLFHCGMEKTLIRIMEFGGKTQYKYYYRHLYILLKK